MASITDFEITYGSALAANKFHRVVAPNGEAADINKGNASSVYLWYKKAEEEAAVVALKLLLDDEATPEGYVKVSKELLKGGPARVYLSFKRQTPTDTALPIVGVRVSPTDSTEEGFEKVEPAVNAAAGLSLFVKRLDPTAAEAAKSEGPKWTVAQLKVGDWFDCKDSYEQWQVAKVLAVASSGISVTYKGYSKYYDEVVPKSAARMAELGTYTNGSTAYVVQGTVQISDVAPFEAVAARVDQFIAGTMDPEDREKFIKQELPNTLEQALSSRIFADLADGLFGFIKKAIELVAHQLANPAPLDRKIVQMFERLFLADDNCNYFVCHYGAVRPGLPDSEGVDGKFMSLPDGGASKYYVGAVNHFGNLDGFELLIKRLYQRDPLIPITEAASYMDVLWVCKYCSTKFMIEDLYPRYRQALFDRILNMTDQELRDVDRNVFGTMMTKLEELLRTVMKRHRGVSTENADETMEKMQLVISQRMLTCPYMSLRLKGLSDIKDMLERVQQRSVPVVRAPVYNLYGRGAYNIAAAPIIKPTAWLTDDLFAEWLSEQQILEVCLGEKVNGKMFETHLEALKRLPNIVGFLAANGKLTVAHIQRLWKIGVESGDTMKRAVFDVLTTAAKSLTVEHFDVIFESLNAVNVTDIDAPVLSLITTLTKFALAASVSDTSTADKSYGMELLWKAVSAPAGLQEDVVAIAEKSFIEMFTDRGDLVQRYVDRCVSNITKQDSVVKSLKLVIQLLRTLPIQSAHEYAFSSQETAVSYLLHTYDIINVVIQDLKAYKALALEAAAKLGVVVPSLDSVGGDALVLVKPESHLNNIKARLDFLAFLLSTPSAVLSVEIVRLLWAELVSNNATGAEREGFFTWLSEVLDAPATKPAAAAAVSVIDQIFDELMQDPDVLRAGTLGPAGFAAFSFAFRSVNVRERKLRQGVALTVLDADLHGIDALWNVAVLASNADVFKAAADLLISLQVKLTPALMANKRTVWEQFVVNCMDNVSTTLTELKPADVPVEARKSGERRVEAALGLLQRFLSTVEDSGRKSKEHYTVPWTITYTYSDGDVIKTIMLPENPTVGQVRTEAGAKIKFLPDRLRVQSKDRKSFYATEEWDGRPYEATGMVHGVATCMPCTRPMVDTEQYEEERIYPKVDLSDPDRSRPRELLCNTPEYFESLFEALSLKRESVVSSSWSLIQLLPINDRVLHAIDAIGQSDAAVDLNVLFSATAPLKLLYSLQIVDKYASPSAKETPEQLSVCKQWVDAFLARGGVQHLLAVLQSCDIDEWIQSTLPQTCLTLLVKVLVTFLSADRFAPSIPELDGADVPALTQRLFRAIDVAVRTAATASDKADEDDDGVFEIKDEGALAIEKKKKTKGKDAGTGGDMEDEDMLDLAKEDVGGDSGDNSTGGSDEPKELLQSKLAATTKESQLVANALALYSIFAYQDTTVRAVFSSEPSWPLLLAGLLKAKDVSLRVEIERGLSQLCASLAIRGGSVAERDALLALLVANIDTAYRFDATCTEFFSLLCRLLKLKADEPPSVDIPSLLTRLTQLIVAHPVLEVTVEEEDFLLRGLLCATASLLSVRPALKESAGGLVKEVFHNCLFAVPSASTPRDSPPPKCKHVTSRKLAFAFLEELSRKSPLNLSFLCEEMVPHHANPAVTISKRGYSVPSLPKSSTGYVGLKNLGCICYMNATIQNFFMVPEFRKGVLEVDDGEPDKAESLMYQLQRMFAFLQDTDKQFYNPKGFCHAFKDWEGNPTNTFVQKDASEFLGMLFQQMEMKLQGSPQEGVIKQCFGGTNQNELIADGKYSAREEPFTFVSLEMKNKKDLYAALRGYISGETVDYKWENEDGSKVELPTQKRTSFKVLPAHLILHLKRFEFDYETMQNSKLNDRFEFPRELDLYEFTADGRPDQVAPAGKEETKAEDVTSGEGGVTESKEGETTGRDNYKYQLTGVVIHSGTAHAGHYYSFIRERLGGGKLGKWMMFNDSSVTPFNADFLEREAFGGVETFKYAYGNTTSSHAVTRNAFVLFYDHVPAGETASPDVDVSGLIGDTSSLTLTEKLSALVLADELKKAHLARAAALSTNAPVPSAIYQAITADNTGFWRERNIYDKTYFAFLSNLLQSELGSAGGDKVGYPATAVTNISDAAVAGGPSFRTVRLATLFVVNTLATSTLKAQWKPWIQRLQALYESNTVACVWFLQTLMANEQLLKRVLFEVDDAAAGLLGVVFANVIASETPLPDPETVRPAVAAPPVPSLRRGQSGELDASELKTSEEIEVAEVVPPFPAPHGAVAVTFLETLLSMLPYVGSQWLKFGAFFKLLKAACTASPAALEYAKRRGVISVLIGFYLDGESPIAKYSVNPSTETAAASSSIVDAYSVAVGPMNKYDALDGIRVTGNTVYASGTTRAPVRQKMGSMYYEPDFSSVMALLADLLLTSLPPSGFASAHQQEPATPLLGDDALLVTCSPFLTKLMSGEGGVPVELSRKLVSHIAWNNEPLARSVADVIKAGILGSDGEAIVPWFKAAAELFAIDDPLRPTRFDVLLSAITTAMQSQQQFYKATEVSLLQFLALTKHSPELRQWAYEHRASLKWMAEWLQANTRAPPYYQTGPIRLNKTMSAYSYTAADINFARPAGTVERFAALLAGRNILYAGFDALDDQTAVIGRRVAVMYPSQKWYLGRVTGYNAATSNHVVTFDDKDEKEYNLHAPKTQYRFVKDTIVLNPWYAPMAVDEQPMLVTVPGVVGGDAPVAAVAAAAGGDANADDPNADDEQFSNALPLVQVNVVQGNMMYAVIQQMDEDEENDTSSEDLDDLGDRRNLD